MAVKVNKKGTQMDALEFELEILELIIEDAAHRIAT